MNLLEINRSMLIYFDLPSNTGVNKRKFDSLEISEKSFLKLIEIAVVLAGKEIRKDQKLTYRGKLLH